MASTISQSSSRKKLRPWILYGLITVLLITPYTLNIWWKFIPSLLLILWLLRTQSDDYLDRLGLVGNRSLLWLSIGVFGATFATASVVVPNEMRLNGIELYRSPAWHLGWATMPLTQSLGEELVLRGLLLNGLLAAFKNKRAAIVGAAVVFAVWHVVFYPISQNVWLTATTVSTLFLFGLATNIIFVVTRSIAIPLALHAGWNLVQFGGEYIDLVTMQSRTEAHVFNAVQGSNTVLSLALGLVFISTLWWQRKATHDQN